MSPAPEPDGMFERPAKPVRRKAAAAPVSAEAFREQFNETLAEVLDLEKWRGARDPGEEYRRIEQEVRRAVEGETEHQALIRREVLPKIAVVPGAPPGAGWFPVTKEEVVATQRELLFNGAVEACDGTTQVHVTLPMTIHQLAVSLVSYRGDGDSWQMRLFRKDVRLRNPDPYDAVMELLEERGRRKGGLRDSSQDPFSELARRGLMTYAERAVLARRSRAPWRMGHGSPAPLELIGAKFTDLTIESIKVIRQLIDHGRFVFVASEPADFALLTIGQGLRPLEYAVIGRLPERLAPELESWAPTHPAMVDTEWDGVALSPQGWVCRFLEEVAPKVVYGLYRATELSPPQLFYAHVDHAAVAARIAIADSRLLEQRGFPLLIDLADRVCKSVYGGGSLREMAETAYAAAGAPFRYQSERATRVE